MKIAIQKNKYGNDIFEGNEYIVDLDRRFEGYKAGDLICKIAPWSPQMPLTLEVAIRADGSIAFRSWDFSGANAYLHTHESADFEPTPEQIDTVNGLWSGRIRYEGLKLAVGASLQEVCPIAVVEEELLTGKKIYLA